MPAAEGPAALNLRARAQLLQAKLLGLPVASGGSQELDEEEDTKSACSSQAPTPPPRLSSLSQQRKEQQSTSTLALEENERIRQEKLDEQRASDQCKPHDWRRPLTGGAAQQLTQIERLTTSRCHLPPPVASGGGGGGAQLGGPAQLVARPITKAIKRQEELKLQLQLQHLEQQHRLQQLLESQQNYVIPRAQSAAAFVARPTVADYRALRPLPPLPHSKESSATRSEKSCSPVVPPPRPPKSRRQLGSVCSNSLTSLASSVHSSSQLASSGSNTNPADEDQQRSSSRSALKISDDSVQLLVQEQEKEEDEEERNGNSEEEPNVSWTTGSELAQRQQGDLLMVARQQQTTMVAGADAHHQELAAPSCELAAAAASAAPRVRPLGQVERAVSLHLLNRQQAGACLPTLAEVQAQMEAARLAQLAQQCHGNGSAETRKTNSFQRETRFQSAVPPLTRRFLDNNQKSTATSNSNNNNSNNLEHPSDFSNISQPQACQSSWLWSSSAGPDESRQSTQMCDPSHSPEVSLASRCCRATPPTPPLAAPRHQQQQQVASVRSQLTIQTQHQVQVTSVAQVAAQHPRVRDLSSAGSCVSSCQNTPTGGASLLSSADSTMTSNSSNCSTSSASSTATLLAQQLSLGLSNSAELIPRLIERLDRKLVVMKREQLALLREIQANELAGQRLFDALRKRLTVAEFDKLSLQANEIEKVTKLILSLRLRLKRVELELKEKTAASGGGQDESSSSLSSSSPLAAARLAYEPNTLNIHLNERKLTTAGGQTSPHEVVQQPDLTSAAASLSVSNTSSSSSSSQQQRGLSDPTSSCGLPKRNHQHHASLQARVVGATSPEVGPEMRAKDASKPNKVTKLKHQSSSSESIFNSADSAIGGSCTLASDSSSSHNGGSANNLHHQQRHLLLSSSVSVASSRSSSMGSNSVPSSPSLMSPASSSGGASGGDTPATQNELTTTTTTTTTTVASEKLADSNNNQDEASDAHNNQDTRNKPLAQLNDDLMAMNLVTELEVLQAKRNKLVAQLEEAHQLEECIERRNATIVERILKKYYPNQTNDQEKEEEAAAGEIGEFKQFTKLKSLLLKDSHDIADRIDNAELQLSELRQSASG